MRVFEELPVQTDGGSDLSIVRIETINGQQYPYCEKHGAMNRVTPGGWWRCLAPHCRAGCCESALQRPSVTDMDDSDPSCVCCNNDATHYNENIRICESCIMDVVEDTAKAEGSVAAQEYRAGWALIADWKESNNV